MCRLRSQGCLCTQAPVAAKPRVSSALHRDLSQCVMLLMTSFVGVKLTLSGLIDGKNFTAGGHKLGLAFELEA